MAKNTLFKQIDKSYVAGSSGVPGDPGRPYRPGYSYQNAGTVCAYGPDAAALAAMGIKRVWVEPGFDELGQYNAGGWSFSLPPGIAGASVPYRYACETVMRTYYVPPQSYIPPTPPVPPTASQVIKEFHLGWNSRARSIRAFPGALRARFSVPSGVAGVVAGLNTSYSQTGYGDIRFAFYLNQGLARIVESGKVVATVGLYTGETVFEVRRLRGKVTYFKDGVQVRETDNDSAPAHLDAALYSGGDSVTDPSIEGLAVGDGGLQPLQGLGGVGTYAISSGVLQPLVSLTASFSGSAGVLQPLHGLASNYAYGAGGGVLPPLAGLGLGSGLTPSYAICDGALALLSGAASGLTGGLVSSSAALPALDGLASEGPYGESAGMFAPLTGWAWVLSDAEKSLLTLFSLSAASSAVVPAAGMVLVLKSNMTAVSLLTLDRAALLALVSAATATTPFTAAGQFALELLSSLQGGSIGALVGAPSDVWVMNAETGGFTRYENFDFNSYAKIGANYYGCKSGGIYQLDGGTDAGAPIQAMVSFGKQNFGTSALKRITNAYVGVSGQGRLFLKVLAEGQEYTYAQRGYDEQLQVQRFDTGKGLRANWLEFELYNADGEDFELASVEFAAVPLSRRI